MDRLGVTIKNVNSSSNPGLLKNRAGSKHKGLPSLGSGGATQEGHRKPRCQGILSIHP